MIHLASEVRQTWQPVLASSTYLLLESLGKLLNISEPPAFLCKMGVFQLFTAVQTNNLKLSGGHQQLFNYACGRLWVRYLESSTVGMFFPAS